MKDKFKPTNIWSQDVSISEVIAAQAKNEMCRKPVKLGSKENPLFCNRWMYEKLKKDYSNLIAEDVPSERKFLFNGTWWVYEPEHKSIFNYIRR